MSQSEHDKELEAFLQRRERFSQRLAALDQEEPPPELDRIVLARAREAIQLSQPTPMFRPTRWALPASLAAGLVLSFVVVLSLRLSTEPQAPPLVTGIAEDSTSEAVVNAEIFREPALSDVPVRVLSDEPRPTPAPQEARRLSAPPAAASPPPAEPIDGWLKRIDELRAQGKTAEADREWKAFREAHPDHPRVRAEAARPNTD